MHFLVIDNRFRVPIFVFLEHDPSAGVGCPVQGGRWVTLEPAAQSELGFSARAQPIGWPGLDWQRPETIRSVRGVSNRQ